MFTKLFFKALIIATITIILDFLFHFFLTHPMESVTYFIIKFLLAFFVGIALYEFKYYAKKKWRLWIIPVTGLIFSILMSTYYRAWELGEAHVPFGSRAPDILGISRDNLILFSGTWWLGHALFFVVGVIVANLILDRTKKKKQK